ncbi:hypothetical protein KM043_016728 [Ampulex compressa]|nr:hypothetical protein KM043_016728 [Ampulex compressa]
MDAEGKRGERCRGERDRVKGERPGRRGKAQDAAVEEARSRWDRFTRVDLHVSYEDMGGARFTRSGQTDESNATIIGLGLEALKGRRSRRKSKEEIDHRTQRIWGKNLVFS